MSRRMLYGQDPVFEHLERQVDELMDHLLRRRAAPARYQRVWAPRVDVYEDPEGYLLVVELPGVPQDAVAVEVEGQEVAIVGERPMPAAGLASGAGQCLQLEIPYGPFERRLLLPEPVDASRASASFEGGILTVRLPRLPTQRRVQVPIR